MIPTDERLAADAARLESISHDLTEIAKRWTTRFPADEAVAEAVNAFLASIEHEA